MTTADDDRSFRCLVCGSAACVTVAADCRDLYLGFPGIFRYVRCAECRLVQLHPVPSELATYYRSYPIHRRKNRLFSWLRSHVVGRSYGVPPTKHSLILDFGCGDGWYLAHVAAAGHSALGFETDPQHAGALSSRLGLPVYADIRELADRHAGTIDLVTMHFVLEHLIDPAATFQLVSRLLKPGGYWYFVIPSLTSLEWRLLGTRWHGFDVPRHVSYLEEQHIRSLAAGSQLTVDRARPLGSATDFAGSVSNIVVGRFWPPVFYVALPLGVIWARIVPGACMSYWLRKPTSVL